MAQLNLGFSDAVAPRILNAIAANYGYQAFIHDPSDPMKTIPNPETKAQFFKRQVQAFVKDNVKAYEAGTAIEAARQAATNSVETDIILS